ncbi:hypothetical protein [Jeongeupia chitinilytica]|uniref:Uncharacterized protein n=1 Tax=Jeongeupia chitinilytica TaxID=1041641 RepID=A0ABQ3H230_9NEIS|nr:hypothetical protein [Jeongeupia chitinilytica]GHD63910.1 hypothetical protein GCM10007350_22310 [Jeongeupia chitinilytica]
MRKPTVFEFGVGASLLWIVGGVLLACSSLATRPVTLDGWGNVLAGFFSPVAFLWLVLGYIQQGQELRQNSEALRLQAEELRNTVEQQRIMSETQQQQLLHEQQQAELAAREKRAASRPNFQIRFISGSGDNSGFYADFTIVNRGSGAAEVRVSTDVPGIDAQPPRFAFVGTDDTRDLRFRSTTGRHAFSLILSYIAADGVEGEQRLQVSKEVFIYQEEAATYHGPT